MKDMVSQPLLKELKTIIQEDYGVELTQTAVVEMANSLTGFFELLAKISCQEKVGKNGQKQ